MSLVLYFMDWAHIRPVCCLWRRPVQLVFLQLSPSSIVAAARCQFLRRPTLILTLYFCLYVFSIVGSPDGACNRKKKTDRTGSPARFLLLRGLDALSYDHRGKKGQGSQIGQHIFHVGVTGGREVLPQIRLGQDISGMFVLRLKVGLSPLVLPPRTAAWRMRSSRGILSAGFVCWDLREQVTARNGVTFPSQHPNECIQEY